MRENYVSTKSLRHALRASKVASFSKFLKLNLLLVSVSLGVPGASAGGVVNPCTEAQLRAALSGGGVVTFDCDGTIVLTNTIIIDHSTTVDASGHVVIVNGNGSVRLFQVLTSVTFTVKSLNMVNGLQQGANSTTGIPGRDGFGAGILNLGGTLNLVDCLLSNHLAQGGQGGLDAAGHARGAAIFNSGGQVNLTNCVLANNRARGGSATGPPAGQAFGGALCAQGGGMVGKNCRFTGNSAIGGDEPVPAPFGIAGLAGGAGGGAIYATSCTLEIDGTYFATNAAVGGASTSSGIGGGFAHGGALALESGRAQISNATFFSNTVQGGTGIRYSSGGAAIGGAVDALGDLYIVSSRFSSNLVEGGASYTPGQGLGGAIAVRGQGVVRQSALDNNEVRGGRGFGIVINNYAGTNGCGGGIFASADLRATNVTLVANRALGGDGSLGSLFGFGPGGPGQGGAICVATGSAVVVHATIFGNTTRGGALGGMIQTNRGPAQGGGIAALGGTTTLFNSILASNVFGSNCFGTIIDGGNNISSDSSCSFSKPGSMSNTDPRLGPYDNYGGSTLTMALLADSPAIDSALPPCPPSDQRGISRPYGSGYDIGAFESAPPYTIRGHVRGYLSAGGTTVSVGTNSANVDASGLFALNGLMPGTYMATPSAQDAVFVLSNRVLHVGPDIVAADFASYRSNAFTALGVSNQAMHSVLAGAAGQTYQVFDSTNLTQWSLFTNGVMPSSGIFPLDQPSNQRARFFKAPAPP